MRTLFKQINRLGSLWKNFAIGVFLLGFLVAVFSNQAVFAQYATGGNGLYKPNIYWLSWGTNGANIPSGTSKTFTVTSGASTFQTTCTLSNYGSGDVFNAYRPGNWGGDGFDNLYNIGGTGTSNTLVSALSIPAGNGGTFRYVCTATLNGSPYTLQGIVFGDSEQSGDTEYVEGTPLAGGTWRIIDRFRTSGCTLSSNASLTGTTLRLTGVTPACSPEGPMAVAFLEGGSSGTITVFSPTGGISAVALGVVINTDYGDAPATYGTAIHVVQPSWSGGTVSGATNAVNNAAFTLATMSNAPTPRLGATVDFESANQPNATATGDDSTTAPGTDDEDGVTMPASVSQGQTVSIPVAVNGTGRLNAWIDWNRDGDFLDAGEQITSDQSVTTGTTNLSATAPANATTGTSYARFRICSTTAECNTPTLIASSGEAEDYSFTIAAAPSFTITKSSNGPWTQGQSGAQYTLNVTNAGGSASSGTITVQDVLPTGITPNWTGTLSTASFSCTFSGQTVTCTRSTAIASLGTAAIVLPVNVTSSSTVGTNTNYASIGGGGDPFGAVQTPGVSCTDTAHCTSNQTTVNGVPDLTITKSHSGNFTVGSTGTYSLTVNNIGTTASSGTITVSDTLPTGLSVANGTLTLGGTNSANWSCSSTSNVITCTSSTAIAASGSSTFSFTVNVGASTAVGTNSITNTATVSGGGQTNTANDSASDPTTVALPLTPCGSLIGVSPGISPADGIYLVNPSTGALTAIGTKPVDSAAMAVQPTTGNVFYFSMTNPTRVRVWNPTTGVTTLLAGSIPTTSTSVLKATFNAAGRLFVADANNLFIEVDPSTGNVISSGNITYNGVNLGGASGDMVFDSNGNLFYTNSNVMYAVDITTRKATLVSTFASGFTFIGLAIDGAGNIYGSKASPNQLYKINPNTGVITLVGAMSANMQDLSSCAFPTPSLSSTKTVAKVAGSSGSAVLSGDTLEYTITTTNSGTVPATSATLVDAIPTGTTYVAGSTTLNGTAVADVSGAMPYTTAREIHGVGMNAGVVGSDAGVNNVATVVFRVTVNTSSTPTTVSNQGTINFANGTSVLTDDPTVSGTSDPTVTNISPADLTLTKSHTGNFTRGGTGTYTMTVNNIGTGSSGGTITVSDTLPTGLSVADGVLTLGGTNSANWSCSAASNVITCTSSTAITASGSSVFTFTVNVASNAPLSVTNTATVSGGGETNTANNSSSDVTNIPQATFSGCDSTMYLTQSSSQSTPSTLYNINTSANPFTFPTLGTGTNVYNAIGYNQADNYLYGIDVTGGLGNSLIRIGADGSTINLGTVSGLPSANYLSGEIGSNGVYYVKANNTQMYAINLSTLTASLITISPGVGGQDLAWSNGMLYTVNASGQLFSINPATGASTSIGTPNITGNFGALYGAPNGLFGNENNGAGFYQFDLTTGQATLISGSPGAQINDGAHCSSANITFPADIAVTKTDSKTTYTAGSTNVYTITATNNGPFGAQNVTVSDPLPSGITTASWTCAGTNGGVCAASGTGAINDSTVDLPNGASVTYTLTMTVPAGFTGSLTNTVTTTVSSSNTDPTPGNNSASDTDASPTYSISGKVFEDYNYGGGAGRNFATSAGSARQSARVELYDSFDGSFINSTTTDASGNYTFTGLNPDNYVVRVVNSTVTSSRTGYVATLIPVQTYRTDASTGTVTAVTNYVGGENPCSTDAASNTTSATLASLTSGTLSGATVGTCSGQAANVPQSVTTVDLSSGNVTGIDFGFNFDTIVNPKNTGQGSLRQFITNANALSNTGLAQVGLTAGRDTTVFMISNGSSAAGLRSALNYFSSGAASIPIASSLPTITDTVTLDGTVQPGYSGSPIIEVQGANMPVGANNHILNFTASNNVVRRLVLNRAGDDAIYAQNGSNGNLFVGNYVGVNVAGTVALGNSSDGIDVEGNNNTIGGLTSADSNIIGGAGYGTVASGQSGIEIGGGATPSSGTVVIGNYIGTNPSGADLHNGITGIEIRSSTGTTTIGGSSAGSANVIAYNGEVGIALYTNTTSGVTISRNSIYANGRLGIDLSWDDVTLNDANDADSGANALLNFPVFENIYIVGGNTTIVGCAPSGATIELFKTDIAMGTAAVGANKVGKLKDYGEGQVYLTTLTEGSGSDTDAGTGCATDVDGNNQTGMKRFSFTIATPSGVSAGTMLTSTATVSATGTSEFSPDFTVVTGLPNVTLLKSCPSPANCTTAAQNPGTDVTYNIAFTNGGVTGAQNVTITDPIPTNTDFKLGTATSSLGTTGLTMVIEYSSDYNSASPGSATWTYTPVSGGGGASAGYDRNVKAIRWRATAGILSNVSPNNTGNVGFIVRIR